MSPTSPVFAILSVIGFLITASGGLVVWFRLRPDIKKLRAETRRVDLDAALAGDKAEDEHWEAIVRTQVDVIVTPLRQEVTELRAEVSALRTEVETFRTRYWRAIAYIRTLLALHGRHSSEPAPTAPSEIAADI